ncbi:hypothetical protein ASC97_32195 [Rhizobium sp. Root1203]|nr:hypothetical protein ASC97_32195 [Rhizobium sp. Root1203]
MEKQVTLPLAPENGILAMAQMADWPKRVLIEDGRLVSAQPLSAGTVTLFDLRKVWTGVRFTPIHYVCFYLPQAALSEVAELEDAALPDEFPNDYCGGNRDQTLSSLARMLLPSFAAPSEANPLFVDHVTMAACAHVLRQYGGAKARGTPPRKLSRGELERSKELLCASVDRDLTIKMLAGEVQMTPTHFVAAFKLSTGADPHEWLDQYRLELATVLLARTDMSIDDIAIAAGFPAGHRFEQQFRLKMSVSPENFRSDVKK